MRSITSLQCSESRHIGAIADGRGSTGRDNAAEEETPLARHHAMRRPGVSGMRVTVVVAALFLACIGQVPSLPNVQADAGAVGANPSRPPPIDAGTPFTGAWLHPDDRAMAVFECPQSPAPPYTLGTSAPTFSTAFQTSCTACHGANGAGKPGFYPALSGALTLLEYQAVVRKGRGNMPAFLATSISDAELVSDYGVLRGSSAGTTVSVSRTHPSTWSQEQIEQKLTRGLEAVRRPDPYGAACVNCHSADAIDLAAIAFPDDAIARRASQHQPPDVVLDIIDYVHALRLRYRIGSPCATTWHVLQPGGVPLSAATKTEGELSFFEELRRHQLLVATGLVDTPEKAAQARQELLKLNLKRVRIPTKLARWTEDGFNGAEHRSFTDWMPGVGRIPKDRAAWVALQQRYLDDPSDENFLAMDAAIGTATEQGVSDSHGRPVVDGFSGTYGPVFWLTQTVLAKYRMVQFASHQFRKALLKQPGGWYELRSTPYPALDRPYNPFFQVGLMQSEPPCFADVVCASGITAAFPEFVKEELSTGQDVNSTSALQSDIWSTLGQLVDPTLLNSENSRGTTHNAFYWNLFTFRHDELMRPFYNMHRMLLQDALVGEKRGTPDLPTTLKIWPVPKTEAVRPVLDGDWLDVMRLEGGDVAIIDNGKDPRIDAYVPLRINLLRTMLYHQKALLTAGAPVAVFTVRPGQADRRRMNLKEMMASFKGTSNLLVHWAKSQTWRDEHPELMANFQFLTENTTTLLDEVVELMRTARPVADAP